MTEASTMTEWKLVVFALWSLAFYPALAENLWKVDGVDMGMSYSQVLTLRGKPRAIGIKQGVTFMVFSAPRARRHDTSVWFSDSKAVFATGYDLERDQEPFFLYGMPGSLLYQELGQPEPLNVFARWWPDSGIVLFGSNALWSDEAFSAPLGLRDITYPRLSQSEPWLDDTRTAWLADDVELGMPEERARKLAGSLEIIYDGGFVRAVRRPQSVLLSHQVGEQDLSLQFDLGQEPVGLGALPSIPNDGWWCPAAGGRIRMEQGKVAEMELLLDDDRLFASLREQSAKLAR